jgi:hypothetical protein
MAPTVLVINPYATDFKLYDEWMHPLGLYFLISLLEDNGIDTRYFSCLSRDPAAKPKKHGTGDFLWEEIEKPELYRSIPRNYKRYGRPKNELVNFLADVPAPDLICVGSMMTYWLPGLAETVKIIASVHPATPILIGGIAARLMPEIVAALGPRVTVAGSLESDSQGSLRLHPALPPLSINGPLSLIGGFRKIDKAYHGAILMSHGCPFSCSYCASSLLHHGFSFRPLEVVAREIRFCAEQRGIVDFAFYDDALLVNPENGIVPLLNALPLTEQKFRFHTPNGLHPRFFTPEIAHLLRNSGFATVRFGYESGAPEHRRDTSEKATKRLLADAVDTAVAAGFSTDQIGVYVMAGLFGQTPAQVAEDMSFVASTGAKVKPVFLSPVPGTPLFERYAKRFPQIKTDPLWHNDLFFITQVDGWSREAAEEIRMNAKEMNEG